MSLSRALKRPLVWSTQVLLTPTKTNTKYSIKQTSKKTCITSFRISSPFTLGPLAKEMTTFSIGLKAKCRCYCGYPESCSFLKWAVFLFVFLSADNQCSLIISKLILLLLLLSFYFTKLTVHPQSVLLCFFTLTWKGFHESFTDRCKYT